MGAEFQKENGISLSSFQDSEALGVGTCISGILVPCPVLYEAHRGKNDSSVSFFKNSGHKWLASISQRSTSKRLGRQPVVLLGGSGSSKKWGLEEGIRSLEACSQRDIRVLAPSCFSLVYYEVMDLNFSRSAIFTGRVLFLWRLV